MDADWPKITKNHTLGCDWLLKGEYNVHVITIPYDTHMILPHGRSSFHKGVGLFHITVCIPPWCNFSFIVNVHHIF